MLRPLLTTLDPQKLVKLQHLLLAARPSLAPLVENRLSGVVHAFLLLPRYRRIVARIARFPATSGIRRDLEGRVVVFRFFGDRCSWCRRRRRNSRGDSWSRRLSDHRLRGGDLSSGIIGWFLWGLDGRVVDR